MRFGAISNGTTVTERSYGKGRVFWGLPMATVLEKLNITPDCDITSRSGDAPINFIHRRVGDAEVYFVANRRRRAEDVVCTFRVKGKQPELWNPETGEITPSTSSTQPMRESACRCNSARRNPCSWYFARPPRRGISAPSPGTAQRSRRTDPFPAFQAGRQRDVTNDFTLSVWIKPDLDVILPPQGRPQP